MNQFFSWAKRIQIFLLERYPPQIGITQSILGTAALFYACNIILNRNDPPFSLSFLYAGLTSFFFLLIMRIADEFKDRDADSVLFKDRCLPAGKVKYEDITLLGILSVILVALFHFIGGSQHVLFIIAMLFVFLFYKYFFFPKIISQNLILALITHCPITLILNSYLLTFFTPEASFQPWEKLLSVAAGMWMSAIAWETARKIRIPEDENEYTTYSKVLGPRGATLLPLLTLLAQVFFFGLPLNLLGVFAILYIPFALFLLSFIFFPTRKKTQFLRPATEALIVSGLIIIVIKGIFFHAY